MSKIRGENGNIKEKKRKQWESWRKSHNEEKIETGKKRKEVREKEVGRSEREIEGGGVQRDIKEKIGKIIRDNI